MAIKENVKDLLKKNSPKLTVVNGTAGVVIHPVEGEALAAAAAAGPPGRRLTPPPHRELNAQRLRYEEAQQVGVPMNAVFELQNLSVGGGGRRSQLRGGERRLLRRGLRGEDALRDLVVEGVDLLGHLLLQVCYLVLNLGQKENFWVFFLLMYVIIQHCFICRH